jgi:diadenosine tetraphosphatase ApaH/serine/threonine PP2A family protein phosphatase
VSDIHGNLEALTAVLADAADAGASALVCLGDIVGYGADPVACVERVASRAAAVVAGNHEHGAGGLLDLSWFNDNAARAAKWTGGALDADHQRYLAALPLRAELDGATIVHASPRTPHEWDYLIAPEDGFDVFGDFDTRLCFVGHSHLPAVWSIGSSGRAFSELRGDAARVRLDHGRRYIVNVGSVGQPRDRDCRAAYALWDLDHPSIAIRRVAYDVTEAARKILSARLPRMLADRLARGR